MLAEPELGERFGALDVVLVDEAQDLTRVELMLLVKLCAVVGQSRESGPPAFIAAGDEAQTVRPSDFEWGHLADLTANLIGRRSEFELPGNVRSPRNIAVVVNQSWDLYRQFAKDERPRGVAEAEVEDAAPGRVVYTVCRSEDELRDLLDVFEAIPNAALVYPGYRIPDHFRNAAPTAADTVLTSHSAKGLDFQTVAVLDIGERLARLRELSQEAETEGRFAALWGRTLADHVRVALSRATETLVLLDFGATPASREEVLALCGDAELLELEPEDVVTFLRRDDSDAAELALEFCEEVEKVLGTQPARAYRRAKQAVGLLGDPRSEDSVQDAALRRQAWLLRGVAAVDLLRKYKQARPKPQQSADDLAADAVTSLRRGERGQDAQAVQLVQLLSSAPVPTAVLGEATELLSFLPQLERHIEHFAREVLIAWCRDVANAPLPPGATAQSALLDTVEAMTTRLSDQHPELAQQRDRLMQNVAYAATSERRYADALALLKRLPVRNPAAEGLCHEHLGNHVNAAQAYELARDPNSALRNLRRVPDVSSALRLAQLLNHEDLPTLQWLNRYCEVMAGLEPHLAARLTDAERRLVAAVRDDAVLDSSPETAALVKDN